MWGPHLETAQLRERSLGGFAFSARLERRESAIMVVGVLKITLAIDAAGSLKDKRRVVKSLIERARHRFNVAIAEVGDNDVHQRAIIGVAAVANDGPFVNSVLDKVLDAIHEDAVGRAEVIASDLEMVHYS